MEPGPSPPEMTPCPPGQEPCVVGEDIGLKLTPDQANTVIEALIGAVIGALVLSALFFGGCLAYRARAHQVEGKSQRSKERDLGYNLEVADREYSSHL